MSHSHDSPGVTAPLWTNIVPLMAVWNPKKPWTRVSKRVPGVHGKRGLERGWQKRLAEGWRKVGERLAKGWRRVGEFPCTLQYCNLRSALLEKGVCDSMGIPPVHGWKRDDWQFFRALFPSINNFDGSHKGGGAKHHFGKNAKSEFSVWKKRVTWKHWEPLFSEVVCTSPYEDFRDINPKLWFP